jgi:hypothetical protein
MVLDEFQGYLVVKKNAGVHNVPYSWLNGYSPCVIAAFWQMSLGDQSSQCICSRIQR